MLPGVVAFLCCAGCVGDGPPEPAYQNRFIAKASPKQTYIATFYNYSKGVGSGFLGATVTCPLYVNVRRRDTPFDPEQGQVFAMRHGYRVRFTWRDETHLLIEYPNDADVGQKAPRIGDVVLMYQPASPSGDVSDAECAAAQRDGGAK